MSNWFSGPFKNGSERKAGTHAAAAETPASFDGDFHEMRVCLVEDSLYLDWDDGGKLMLNMRHCDQLMLGESTRRTPRWLALRFRHDRFPSEQREPGAGMILMRIGLRDRHELQLARELYTHLVTRFRWLAGPSSEDEPRPSAEAPAVSEERGEYPLGVSGPREHGSEAQFTRPAEPAPPYALGEDPAVPAVAAPPRNAAWLLARTPPMGLAGVGAPEPAPGAADDWLGFVPGPRTRRLYEDVRARRREAEGR